MEKIRIRQVQIESPVLAIITSDWHLRESQPVCRLDNFWEAQWKKIDFISALQIKYDCPIYHAGDLFEYWKPSPFLLSECIKRMPAQFYTIYGNHDLPQHSLDLAYKSGVHVLENAGVVNVLSPGTALHWGMSPEEPDFTGLMVGDLRLLIWHTMTWFNELPYPGCSSPDAYRLLRKYGETFDVILTGHNHKPFTTEMNGSVLINPGAITRQNADEDAHKPRVYLLHVNGKVTPVFLPIKTGTDVISRAHIDVKKERDERLEAFISRLDTDWSIGLNFKENLDRFFEKNQIRNSVKTIIYDAFEA